MEARNLTTAVKKTGLVLLVVIFFATTLSAQGPKVEKQILGKAAIKNLVAGIESSNDGVKLDCIYYAAIYGIHDAVDMLKSELKKEKNPSTRVLIALALYKLGVNAGGETLSKYVLIDWEEKVRSIDEAFGRTNKYQNTVTASAEKE